MNRRLFRSRTDSVIGGVAGGVAEYLDVDPSIVRIVWAILAIVTGGIFLVLYVVMWIAVPETPTAPWMPGTGAPPQPGAVPGWQPPGQVPPPAPGEPPAQLQPLAGDASAMPPEGATPAASTGGAMPADTTAMGTAGAGYAGQGYGGQAWSHDPSRRRGRGGAMIFGMVLVALGIWFLVDEFLPGIDTDLLWPVGLVLLGALLLFVSTRKSA